MSTWREQAAPIIARVIAEIGRDDEKKLRAALRKAYPFGERAYHPYKIWCEEVRRQIGETSPTMSVADALKLEREIWNGWTLNLSGQDCYRLKKLGDELSIGVPPAEEVTRFQPLWGIARFYYARPFGFS